MPPGLHDQVVLPGELAERREQRLEGTLGVGKASRVHGDGEPLVLDEGLPCVVGAQQPGQLALEGRQPLGRARGDDATPRGGPALVAVLPEEVELAARLPHGGTDLLQPAEVERLPRRATGDDGDGTHLGGQRDQHVAGVGVDVRLLRVVDDRRQCAVEVEPDDAARGGAHERFIALLTLPGGEVHAP